MAQTLTTAQLLEQFPQIGEAKKKREEKKTEEAETEKWLKSRGGNWTASAFANLFTKKLALSKGDTAKSYIRKKVGERLGAFPERVYSKAMSWGSDHEEEAIEYYAKQTGQDVYQNKRFLKIAENVGCTPDAFVLDNLQVLPMINERGFFTWTKNGHRKLLQIKCPYTTHTHVKNLCLTKPEELKEDSPIYYVQVNFEMMCMDADSCDFVSYDKRFPDNKKCHILNIPRDVDLIKKIREALEFAENEAQEILKKIG